MLKLYEIGILQTLKSLKSWKCSVTKLHDSLITRLIVYLSIKNTNYNNCGILQLSVNKNFPVEK